MQQAAQHTQCEHTRGLGLRAHLVGRNEEKSAVHHCRPVKHCRHENVVTRAIDKRHVAEQLHAAGLKARHLALRVVLFAASIRSVAGRPAPQAAPGASDHIALSKARLALQRLTSSGKDSTKKTYDAAPFVE